MSGRSAAAAVRVSGGRASEGSAPARVAPALRGLGAMTALAIGLVATRSHALWDDRFELFAAEAVTRDDNVFRLSRAVDASAALGSNSRADTYYTTSLGLNFDVSASRQRLTGGLVLDRTRYRTFSVLDRDGHAGRATWIWQAGDRFNGELGYTQALVLASLANVQGGVQSSTPDPLRTRRIFADATYRLTPRWLLRGQASGARQDNSAEERRINDVRTDAEELVLSYLSPADNRLGLLLRQSGGRLPNRQPIGTIAVDNSYRQRSAAADTEWTLSGESHLKARAGRVQRSFRELGQRDFAASIYYGAFDWKPTGKLTLTAVAQRDISATEEINVGFVVAQGFALYPALRLSEKLSLNAGFERVERRYFGDPGLVLGTVAPRTDQVQAWALSITYRPVPVLLLGLSARRETRSSSAAFGDYAARVVSLSARLGL